MNAIPFNESRMALAHLSRSGRVVLYTTDFLADLGLSKKKLASIRTGPSCLGVQPVRAISAKAVPATCCLQGLVLALSAVTTGKRAPLGMKAFMLPWGAGVPNTVKVSLLIGDLLWQLVSFTLMTLPTVRATFMALDIAVNPHSIRARLVTWRITTMFTCIYCAIIARTIAVPDFILSHQNLLRPTSILKPLSSFMVVSQIVNQFKGITWQIVAHDHIFVKLSGNIRFCAHA